MAAPLRVYKAKAEPRITLGDVVLTVLALIAFGLFLFVAGTVSLG